MFLIFKSSDPYFISIVVGSLKKCSDVQKYGANNAWYFLCLKSHFYGKKIWMEFVKLFLSNIISKCEKISDESAN